MPMTPEEQAEFDAVKAKAAEVEQKLTEAESKAKAAEEYKKDMLKFKDEATQLKKEKEEGDKKGMLEKEQYKALYEKTDAELVVEKKKNEDTTSKVDRFIKQGALETAALQAGVKKEALGDLKRLAGFESLEVKTEGDDIKVLGVEALLAEQKKLRPYLFGDGKPPRFDDPKNPGGGGEKVLSVADIRKLEKENPLEYRAYMEKNQKAQQAALKK